MTSSKGYSKWLKWGLVGAGAVVLLLNAVKGVVNKISFAIGKLKLNNISFNSTSITLDAIVTNDNPFNITIEELKGNLYYQDDIVGHIAPATFVMIGSGTVIAPLTIKLLNTALITTLLNVISQGNYGALMSAFKIAWTIDTQYGTFQYNQPLTIEN
jgi:LEA14-like dessication related protein